MCAPLLSHEHIFRPILNYQNGIQKHKSSEGEGRGCT